MSEPFTAPPSAVPDQLASALRQLLVAVGAYGAGKGWFDASIAAAAVPVIMIVGPMLWSQLRVRAQVAKLAEAVAGK